MTRYWTNRYLTTLCVGLIIIGIISTIWIRYSAAEKRLDFMRLIAAEVADRAVDTEGKLHIEPSMARLIEQQRKLFNVDSNLILFIMDDHQRVIYSQPRILSHSFLQRVSSVVEDNSEKVSFEGDQYYFVRKAIEDSDKATLGWVNVLYPNKGLTASKDDLLLLVIMLTSLALLGWGVINLLTRQLIKPIKEVANAATQIVGGNYSISLNKNIKEKEVYELIYSFKEMADRLRQTEALRRELLAGVTHELKTPVASISGLVQAVKDNVVTGAEAKEFLDICTKETDRLRKMIEDLLYFNSFAVGAIKVNKETQNLNQLLQEITYQWRIVEEESRIHLNVVIPEAELVTATDPARIQQILINLLNNAKQALGDDGNIEVALYETPEDIRIDVKNNGTEIPQTEQHLIFERFYRGQDKKHKVRGLGLGLPFSRMIAQALGGNLVLKESTTSETIFTVILPK